MQNYSVLQKYSKSVHNSDCEFKTVPFPYLIIKDALPSDLYIELLSNFPAFSSIGANVKRNNYRYSYSASKVLHDTRITSVWKDFVNYHSSHAFFEEIAEIFGDAICALYPEHFKNVEELKAYSTTVRNIGSTHPDNISIDAQICCNTPVFKKSSVRTAHLDSGDKLYTGLYYFRRDDDDSCGGDLELFKFKSQSLTTFEKANLFKGPNIHSKYIDLLKTVPYKGNTLVIFINSLDSIHGVSPRETTDFGRFFLNVVGELPMNLYETPAEPFFEKLFRKLY